MSFLPNIPQSTDQLSVSQGNILNNFSILGAIAGNSNASSSSINSTSGFNWIYLPPQGAMPPAGAAFTSGNVGLYSATNATTTNNELYINKNTFFGLMQIPATASSNAAVVNSTAAGWTYLPSGIKMVWGTVNIPGPANNVTVAYSSSASFPGFSSFVGSLQLTRISTTISATNNFPVIRTLNNITSFTVFGSQLSVGSDINFFWLAIGF